MLVTINPNRTLWEALLPAECLEMSAELVAVDRLLDDPVFFEPYRRFFDPIWGRPSIPVETYLRLMFLKARHGLSFEAVVREAADSLSWRRFCRVPLGERMPHATTLMKTTKRCGESTIEALNESLLAKAVAAHVVKSDKVRIDTTVVEANVAYPTDSGLLAKGVAKMAGIVKALKGMGLATRTTARDRTRSMRRRAHAIGAWLRRRSDDAKDEVMARWRDGDHRRDGAGRGPPGGGQRCPVAPPGRQRGQREGAGPGGGAGRDGRPARAGRGPDPSPPCRADP